MAALGGVKELSMLVKEQQRTITELTDRLSRVEALLSRIVA